MHVFTSAAVNYLAKARVLAESVKRHHADAQVHLVLSDRRQSRLDEAFATFDSVIHLDELPIANRQAWIFQHSLVELCTAVKGLACGELMRRFPDAPVLYLDPDVVVLAPLDSLLAEFRAASILLTPHLLEPEQTLEGIVHNEMCTLQHGLYNLGFLGLAPTAEARRFVAWWTQRLEHFCQDWIEQGLFTDQRWVDLAPVFFPDLKVLRDPGYNVATWNLAHRPVSGSLASGLQVAGQPLRFFHFSGFDSGAHHTMLERFSLDSPVLRDLRNWYVAECQRLGQEQFGRMAWGYGQFENGEPITPRHRRVYRTYADLQRMFPTPWATTDVKHSYYHWFRQNGEAAAPTAANPELEQKLLSLQQQLQLIRHSRSYRMAQWVSGLHSYLGFKKRAA